VLEIDPSHPFGNLPILSSPLLQELKSHHLTLKLYTHAPTTTGIPAHIAHLCNITTIKGCCKDIKAAILEFKGELRETVSQAIDDKVEESGGIYASILDSWIQALEQRLVNCLEQIGTAPLLNTRVEVNCVDASAAPVVAKANRVSIGVFLKICIFLARPTG
jgi:hypothetical protein